MKKAFGKIGQSLGEKTGSYIKTEFEPEFDLLDKYTVDLKKGLESIVGATTDDLLYPDGSQKGMMKLSKSKKYKHPETQLGDALISAGRNIGNETGILGPILEYMGEVEKEVGDAHSASETDIQQMFVEPINSYIQSDVKEVMAHRKKLHSRRLDFDAKKRDMGKRQDEKSEEAYRIAESKFEETKEITMQGMTGLTNGEAQQVSQLLALVEAQKGYHNNAAATLESLGRYLQEQLAAADAAAPREYVASSFNSRSHDDPPAAASGEQVVVALYEFVAESDAELSFPEGAQIVVTEAIDENWLEGDYNGFHGIFPKNYVE